MALALQSNMLIGPGGAGASNIADRAAKTRLSEGTARYVIGARSARLVQLS